MIESHPDNALEDLRLDQPFAELKNHIQSYDLEGMGKKVCLGFSFFFSATVVYCVSVVIWSSLVHVFSYALVFCRITVIHHGSSLLPNT